MASSKSSCSCVGLGHHPAQPGLGAQVVGAVHQQERVVGPAGTPSNSSRCGRAAGPAPWRRRAGRRRCRSRRPGTRPGPGAVGRRHRKAVRSTAEGTPRHTTAWSNPAWVEELGHLGDVAEHVGQVARPPWRRRRRCPARCPVCRLRTMVSPDTRNSSIRMYQGPTVIRPAAARAPQPGLVLGADLQVVVDDRQLAVEQEVAVGAVALHQVEQVVDQADQLQAEGLERLVPLPVPVGVGDDGAPGRACRRSAAASARASRADGSRTRPRRPAARPPGARRRPWSGRCPGRRARRTRRRPGRGAGRRPCAWPGLVELGLAGLGRLGGLGQSDLGRALTLSMSPMAPIPSVRPTGRPDVSENCLPGGAPGSPPRHLRCSRLRSGSACHRGPSPGRVRRLPGGLAEGDRDDGWRGR